ncbi:Imm26 family immunity protein [Agromyces aerolatus]|uniref:Imm26 family immunity protein n=1 Tax=Agromyces sp. LY-1074 TaxID=3074080 RepID=UPI00285F090D|nr:MULTISPECIES: Imm26 family immunity protein [unclassified Agromyces]MDR5699479.1 Imm26 family immunity protein [Agromyces sp. LY-1074]MDR5705775.1 Imm26 family immunity protein [Agromyces sp. LY-1358]
MVNKASIGDVFVVPVGDGRAGVGQVVARYGGAYYFAIFEVVLPLEDARQNAREALERPVLFLALSMDAKLYAGHWTVVDHATVAEGLPLPAYKVSVGTPDNVMVVDFSGSRSRPASEAEAEVLPYRDTVAPVRLEKALRAWLGLDPWLEAFDELKPAGRVTTADLFH